MLDEHVNQPDLLPFHLGFEGLHLLAASALVCEGGDTTALAVHIRVRDVPLLRLDLALRAVGGQGAVDGQPAALDASELLTALRDDLGVGWNGANIGGLAEGSHGEYPFV
ncbi:MAG: hypothetical protein ACYC35_26075 [Pirellulales bacterium]